MKKGLLYFFAFVFICFLLPAMLTKTKEKSKETEETIKEVSEQPAPTPEYAYTKYNTISLLHKKTGEVEQVPIDEYLVNVVSAEMPADFEVEALKAQAIVARTYTIYKAQNKKHENADICDESTCCQAWINKE